MVGGVEILEEAKKVAPSKKAMKAIRRLEKIYANLICLTKWNSTLRLI